MSSKAPTDLTLDLPSPISFMADAGMPSGRRDSATAKAPGRSSSSPLRRRPMGRAATLGSTYGDVTSPGAGRRRDSLMTESLKSSTDDLLLPRVSRTGMEIQQEPSHWHSAPLGLALLPAFGGLFFTNGSAIVTDITLLLLAAVFLNWSVRLPW